MAIQVKHQFTSGKTDGADATQIQPSNWNADHTIQVSGPAIVGKTTAGTGAATELTAGYGIKLTGTEIVGAADGITAAVSRDLTAADIENVIDATAAITLSVPTDAVLGITSTSSRVAISAYQATAGAVNFAPVVASGVLIRGTTPTPAQYNTIGIMHVGLNEWAYV